MIYDICVYIYIYICIYICSGQKPVDNLEECLTGCNLVLAPKDFTKAPLCKPYIYIYIYTYVYTYIYIYIYICSSSDLVSFIRLTCRA